MSDYDLSPRVRGYGCLWIFAIFLLIGAIFGIVGAQRRDARSTRECEARGGETIDVPRSAPICVKKGTVLK